MHPLFSNTSLIDVSTMICSVEFESQAQSSLCLRYHVVWFWVIHSVHGFAKPTDAFYASHLRMFISSCCSSGTWCLCIVGCARFNLTCHDIESDDTVHVLHVYFRDKLLLSSNPHLFALIHISAPTRLRRISYAAVCLKKKQSHETVL